MTEQQMTTGAMSVIGSQAEKDSSDAPQTIESRFGAVKVDKTKGIVFPRGLLGMPDKFNFCLTDFPSERMRQFKLLQSLDDAALSFITLPLDVSNSIIAEADIEQACADVGIAKQDVAVLLVVSVHRMPTSLRVSVNARAPLLVDAPQRLAMQYVFSNEKYKVQHIING